MIEAYFDGACEPVNPGGTAAYGVVVYKDKKRIWQQSKLFVPMRGREKETSNNVAEYSAFLSLLHYLLDHKLNEEKIIVYGDSMLVLCQMLMDHPEWHKRYRIKRGFYVGLALQAQMLMWRFPKMEGHWIPREKNTIADELSKAELIRAGVQFRIQLAS